MRSSNRTASGAPPSAPSATEPPAGRTRLTLGLAARGDLDDGATQHYRAALHANPSFSKAPAALALVLAARGDTAGEGWKRGQRVCTVAVTFGPGTRTIHSMRGLPLSHYTTTVYRADQPVRDRPRAQRP